MRRRICVLMMTLCLLLSGCGARETKQDLRKAYREMTGCSMEATVICEQSGLEWEALLRCEYVPGGDSSVEVLEPSTIAGVKAIFQDSDWLLRYEDAVLNAGSLSDEAISPALCLPRLMDALRNGWLLEENEEVWDDVPCLRLTVDQSGSSGKILSTLWLRQTDGTPLRGEIAVDEEIILTAEFTNFEFYDMINN